MVTSTNCYESGLSNGRKQSSTFWKMLLTYHNGFDGRAWRMLVHSISSPNVPIYAADTFSSKNNAKLVLSS